MGSVIVVGGGPIGLASAMLLAREGHDVTVLEKDPQGPPASAFEAWRDWQRTGVAQFRQAHAMHARFRHLLDAEFPDIRDDIVASGGRRVSIMTGFLNQLEDRSQRPGDEKFETITARRPIVESAFARAAENTPGVKVIRGVSVAGPIAGKESAVGIPHVAGVRTKDGSDYTGDLVIDASGRKSAFDEWVVGLGGRPPLEEKSDLGFAYYTRHYQCRDGFEPELRRAPVTLHTTFQTVSLPTDNDTWVVAIICMAGDKPMKAVRQNEVWERVIRAVPHLSHWIEGDPLHDVHPMAGAADRYRRFVVDGSPVVTGIVAIGDSWACTNPTAGRGISLGLGHAIALRDAARTYFDEPLGLATTFDEITEEKFTPWYRQQIDRDRGRVAAINAAIEGREPPKPDVSDPIVRLQLAFATAAGHDPEVARGFAEVLSALTLPQHVMARPGMYERVIAAAEGRETPETPGPNREQMLKILSDD
jgi:2-polyprenyl-6-methoxyphenol hydroxylase-like FAD-dependent oxidoreductase